MGGARRGARAGRSTGERCSECGHLKLFPLDHAIVFRGQFLEKDTLACLLRRADVLMIGGLYRRNLLRSYLSGVPIVQLTKEYGLPDRRHVKNRILGLLKALWKHDGRGECV